jgi:hypothetical protein
LNAGRAAGQTVDHVSVQSSGPAAGILRLCSESCEHGPRRGGGDL